jgi:putative nucleotidyltransferase with HDIG domain
MAVPTRTEALALLWSVSPSTRLLQHMTVVAEIAAFLAYRAARAGVAVDRRLAETAALLHDVDKALPADHPLKRLGHGRAAAEWVTAAGHPELARAIMAHPVSRLAENDAAEWLSSAPLEERLVMYADKRATQRVVSLEQRFDRWRRRHPEYEAQLQHTLELARRLEAEVCAAADIVPTQVERLRWVHGVATRAAAQGLLPGQVVEACAPGARSMTAPGPLLT